MGIKDLMTEHSPQPDDVPTDADADAEISLLDLLIVLAKHKILILGLPFVTAVIVAGYSLTLPNIYKATTKILPPQQSQSSTSAILSQLGGMLGGAVGLKSSNDLTLYIAMLKSRTIADNLIERFGLMRSWNIDSKHPSDAYKLLEGRSNIAPGKDGLINIEIEDKDPKFAAELANAYVEELFKLTSVVAVTEASQRRLFFERQAALAKDNLAKAETAARQALQSGGLVRVEEQGRSKIETAGRLRGLIASKEVQIGAMRMFAADRNPDLQFAQQEIESMKRELAKVEEAESNKPVTQGRNGPGLDNQNLLRDVKYYETIYEMLSKQFEMAKIEEAKDPSIIQVLDKAIEPDRKSKPIRSLMVLISATIAFFAGITLAFVREEMAKSGNDPRKSEQLQRLRRYLAWR
jgi:tyrosine-protein kinase Etk/Wzc